MNPPLPNVELNCSGLCYAASGFTITFLDQLDDDVRVSLTRQDDTIYLRNDKAETGAPTETTFDQALYIGDIISVDSWDGWSNEWRNSRWTVELIGAEPGVTTSYSGGTQGGPFPSSVILDPIPDGYYDGGPYLDDYYPNGSITIAGPACTDVDDEDECLADNEGREPGNPGERGPQGFTGDPGADGAAAYTTTTSAWRVPPAGELARVNVVSSDRFTVGQPVFFQTAGYFTIDSIPSATALIVEQQDTSANLPDNAIVTSGVKVVGAGIVGAPSTGIQRRAIIAMQSNVNVNPSRSFDSYTVVGGKRQATGTWPNFTRISDEDSIIEMGDTSSNAFLQALWANNLGAFRLPQGRWRLDFRGMFYNTERTIIRLAVGNNPSGLNYGPQTYYQIGSCYSADSTQQVSAMVYGTVELDLPQANTNRVLTQCQDWESNDPQAYGRPANMTGPEIYAYITITEIF